MSKIHSALEIYQDFLKSMLKHAQEIHPEDKPAQYCAAQCLAAFLMSYAFIKRQIADNIEENIQHANTVLTQLESMLFVTRFDFQQIDQLIDKLLQHAETLGEKK